MCRGAVTINPAKTPQGLLKSSGRVVGIPDKSLRICRRPKTLRKLPAVTDPAVVLDHRSGELFGFSRETEQPVAPMVVRVAGVKFPPEIPRDNHVPALPFQAI